MFMKKFVTSNFIIVDYKCKNIEFKSPLKCFIIWHFAKGDLNALEEKLSKIIQAGCRYFRLFGEHYAIVFDLIKRLDVFNEFEVYGSQVDLDRITQDIIFYHSEENIPYCYLIEDISGFSNMIIEDFAINHKTLTEIVLERIEENSNVVEFEYNGKDCVVSLQEDLIIGYLGHERRFDYPFYALSMNVFDGKCLLEIWDEVKDQFM